MRRLTSECRSRGKGGLGEALAGAGVTRETVFGFADEMRVGLRGTVRWVWGCRGVKVRQRVQTVYEWMYLFCVVDGRRGRLLWIWIDSMKSACIAEAVNGLKHGSVVEALVWDGARGHRGRLVEVVGLPTVVQPAYSPDSILPSGCSRRSGDGWKAGSMGASRRRSRR